MHNYGPAGCVEQIMKGRIVRKRSGGMLRSVEEYTGNPGNQLAAVLDSLLDQISFNDSDDHKIGKQDGKKQNKGKIKNQLGL